jgi:anaerobic magnesium-protoporphyrin IX monomethyl ester cyclase
MALYYLRNQVNPGKYGTAILEKTINDHVWDILTEINAYKPDILCLSCYIWNQNHTQNILKDIKKILPSVKIICGGPDISYNSEDWLDKFQSIDFIIQGAGEKAFYTLCENEFNYNDKIIKIDNYQFTEIKLPYNEYDKEKLNHRYIYYEASRGCPYKCSYCISSISEHKFEFKDIDTVKKEVEYLASFEPLIVKFVDRSFNVNTDFCIQIWEFIRNMRQFTKFHFEINPDFLNEKQVKELRLFPKDQVQLEVGIQTVHNKTLANINRGGSWSKTKKALDKLEILYTNIHLHYDMIVGLPGESLKDIHDSFNKIIRTQPHHFQVGFLKVLPGTQISKDVCKWGYKYQEQAPYRVLSTDQLSFEDLYAVELAELAVDLK